MPSDALAAPQMPPIREIRPRGGTQKSVEGRWTHHVRCFFVPLTHRPDVCGWFGRWGRLGLRHLGGWLVSGRREPSAALGCGAMSRALEVIYLPLWAAWK